jgi:hypothetical protein
MPIVAIRRRRAVLALVAAVFALAVAGTAAALQSSPTPVGTPPQTITPLAATVLSTPNPVPGDDGRVHLAYELFVTNPTTSVMRLRTVEVLAGSRVLDTFAGARLDAGTRPLDPTAPLDVAPGQVTRVMLDTTLGRWGDVPDELAHRFTFTLTKGATVSTTTVVSGRTTVRAVRPVEVAPPLRGPRWLTAGGCCFPPSYHRSATLPVNGAFHGPERFAIDFVQLDGQDKLFEGAQNDLSHYAYFGTKVHSVADGRVVGLLDGLPEQTPPDFPPGATAETAGGNYVVVDIGDGHFAYYAHMQPGSLRVRVGDRVRTGDVIGLLGNTGNSNGPHLHFQITDSPLPLASEGLPFVFRAFTSRGTLTNSLDDVSAGRAAVIGPDTAGPHRDEMPLQDQVVDFTGS